MLWPPPGGKGVRMHSGQLVFSQLMEFLPRHELAKCVARYQGNHRARRFRCWDQFLCMAFGQLTYRESLRDIKQHLRIKSFYGVSANAVKTQIWIAISTYVLVAILKKRLGIEHSLYTILQILSVSAFERIELSQAFSSTTRTNADEPCRNQLQLFDF